MLCFGRVDSPQAEVLSAAGQQLVLAAISVRGANIVIVVLVVVKSTHVQPAFSLSKTSPLYTLGPVTDLSRGPSPTKTKYRDNFLKQDTEHNAASSEKRKSISRNQRLRAKKKPK